MSSALRALATLTFCLAWGLAKAQESEAYVPDPPDRAARLSYVDGNVSMQPAGEEEWAPAIVNRPLTTGDKLWTERGARAEIYVGRAAVRLGDTTGFSFLNLDDDTIQMRMTAGVIHLTVRALEGSDQIEIDTPNVALSILRPGEYRVEVNDAGDATTVRISEGEAQATSPQQDVIVHAQQVVTFRGLDELTAQWSTLGEPDEFDLWSADRERRAVLATTSRTAEYVSPDVTGYEDLEDNGTWSTEPEYGNVWTPRVAIGWSPYQYGRWVSVAPWGWTWIDDAPWGYAPFHYGRWAHVRQRWCWVPGPRHVRPVYAPALVGWIGPPGVRVGWFPLGPREVYVPGRRFSHRYLERVNVSNTVIVNRTYLDEVYNHRGANVAYRNRTVPGAVTAVARATFASGGRIGGLRLRDGDADFARARVTAGPQVDPVRESRLGGVTRVYVRTPPQTVVDRQVIVQRAPPASVAHFTRSRSVQEDLVRPATERFARPQDRERPAAETNLRTAPRASEPGVPEQRSAVAVPREGWQTRQRQGSNPQAHPQAERQRENDNQRQQYEQRQPRQQQPPQQQQPQQQQRERSSAPVRVERAPATPRESPAARPAAPRTEAQPPKQRDYSNRPQKD